MKLNAHINSRLKDLLEILDARAFIEVYSVDNENKLVLRGRVYEILTDKTLFNTYKNYEVSGLVLGLVHRILISKEA